MNTTRSGLPAKSARDTDFPSVSGRLKSGARVPSFNIVDSVCAIADNLADVP
jgi:hypothetical protein